MILKKKFKDNNRMRIFINGLEKKYAPGLTLEMLINELGHVNKKIAIEVNEEIVPRSHLKNKLVCDGDKIEIITAVGGG